MKRPLIVPVSAAVVLATGALLGSCESGLFETEGPADQAPIHVTAFAIGTPISTLVIEVTAADINKRLVFNLEVVDGVASGIITVPAGEARTFTVQAYDDHHNVTHEGSATTDVNPGSNPPLKVKLKPVAGDVDITVTFGDYGVVITPSTVGLDAIGATATLVATVYDQYGDAVPDALPQWATTHPTIALVSAAGVVTALAEGEATIVATYAGVAGVAEVTVLDLAGSDVCDGVDNNGDGQIDEGLVYCINGTPAPHTDGENSCLPGWGDLDGDPINGCEEQMAEQEICNGIDDDLDGEIDEYLTYCIMGNPAPNTNGENACLHGWENLDGLPDNGCEVPLTAGWRHFTFPTLNIAYHDVWASPSGVVFAVGWGGYVASNDGSYYPDYSAGWDDTHAGIVDWPLNGVWGSSESNVFVVGDWGIILHYDGAVWTTMAPEGSWSFLNDVWGLTPTDVYAVGFEGTILHYDGTEWIEMMGGVEYDLYGIWGSSPTNLFAVGWDVLQDRGLILHYDGTSWTVHHTVSVTLTAVWGSAANDVFAVGEVGAIVHYDGSVWTEQTSGVAGALYGIWGSSATDVYAVGGVLAPIVLHNDGVQWGNVSEGWDPAGLGTLLSVSGSSSSNVFVVGSTGTGLCFLAP